MAKLQLIIVVMTKVAEEGGGQSIHFLIENLL